MRRVGWIVTAMAGALLIAGFVAVSLAPSADAQAPPAPTTLQELDENRQVWDALGIETYRLTYRVSCGCLSIDPVTAEVVDGELVRLLDQDGRPIVGGSRFTVDDLFDRIAAALLLPADRLLVSYDAEFGIPLYIDIDEFFELADEESTVTILEFDPTPRAIERAGLDAARVLWQTQDTDSYRLTYQVFCFCLSIEPVTAVVVEGLLNQLLDQGGRPIDPATVFSFTVEDLFDRIERAIDLPAEVIVVEYDPDLGVPLRIEIDESFQIADEELTIVVLGFDPSLAPPRSQRLEFGWNLTGWTGATPVTEATAPIASSFDALFAWDAAAQVFLAFANGLPPSVSSLQELAFGDGLWVHVTDPDGVEWPQPAFEGARDVALEAGFNLELWTGPSEFAVSEGVAGLGDSLTAVYLWDALAQRFLRYAPDAPDFANTATTLRFGDGAWLELSEPAVWRQPASATTISAPLGTAATLVPGERLAIEDTTLELTFVAVARDSRCPIDVQCVTAGEATVSLRAALEDLTEPLDIVVLGYGSATASFDAFEVTVVEILPKLVSTGSISPDDYRVTLRVERAP